ncbi:MAG: hypothetical protein K6E54_02610 [Bacteroidaceae bacterium]|nr:hypothetical protein [Bacteroidaceae bacterium]
MTSKVYISLFLVSAVSSIHAQTLDLHHDMTKNFASEIYKNPALQLDRYETSLNKLTIGYDGRQETEAILPENGDGHNKLAANIDAYIIKGKYTLWGIANYTNGLIKNQQNSETSDWQTLYPYIMSDTVGGNINQEKYHFLGGFAHKTGKLQIGAEGEYKATMEYRTVDPRPANMSGDLKIKLGASLDINSNVAPGIAISGRRYKQTNNIELYNETSVPTIFHLTGLGHDYYRFQGEYTNTYYQGWGYGTQFTLSQKDKKGYFASLDYDFMQIKKIMSDLNSLPLTKTKNNNELIQLGWIGRDWGIKLNQKYLVRKGNENIFGTAANNIFPQIGTLEQYRLEIASEDITGMWQKRNNNRLLGVNVGIGIKSIKETYQTPSTKSESSDFHTNLNLLGDWFFGNWYMATQSKIIYEWAMTTKSERDYFNHNRLHCLLALETGYKIDKKCHIYIKMLWNHSHYSINKNANSEYIALGIRF